MLSESCFRGLLEVSESSSNSSSTSSDMRTCLQVRGSSQTM